MYKEYNKYMRKIKGGENVNEFIKAGKEGLRVAVLAMIPIAIDGLSKGSVDLKLIAVAGLVALLRFADSWLHETGMAEKGITRF